MTPTRFPLLRAVATRALDLLATLADSDAADAGTRPHQLAFPLLAAALLAGIAILLVALQMPRLAIVTLALSLIVTLAILRERILNGDR